MRCLSRRALILIAITASVNAYDLVPSGTYLRAALTTRVRPGKLQPGSVLDARLVSPMYAGGREVAGADTPLRLVVAHVAKRQNPKRPSTASRVFAIMRGQWAPAAYDISLRSAALHPREGNAVALDLSLLTLADQSRSATADNGKRDGQQILLARLNSPAALSGPAGAEVKTIAAGTKALLVLLGTLTAEHAKNGDPVTAQLLGALRTSGGLVLPDGTVFSGRVIGRTPPRRLHRAGHMRLAIDRVHLPGGSERPVSLSVTSVQAETAGHLSVDGEGTIGAMPLSKLSFAINLLTGYGLGKLTDDLLEEGIKGAISSATPASAATAARYVGLGIGAAWFLSQRGRDVRLPAYSILGVSFNRDPIPQP